MTLEPTDRSGSEQVGSAGVVVLGMHRSGTSAVNGMFVSAGFYLGEPDDALPANQFNPHGFAEHRLVLELNDRLLRRIGSNWFDAPPPSAFEAIKDEALARIGDLVTSLRDAAGDAPLALKDPRIGVMWPVWGPVIGDLLHPVLVIRDPVEIAASLAVRNGLPTPISLASWELQTTTVLGHLRGRTVTVVDYEQLLNVPERGGELVAEVTSHLSPRYGQQIDPTLASSGLDPELRRNRVQDNDHHTYLTGFQRDLGSFLQELETGTGPLDVPAEMARASDASRAATRAECQRMLRRNWEGWRYQQAQEAIRRLMALAGESARAG
jgi:hypothetical protein